MLVSGAERSLRDRARNTLCRDTTRKHEKRVRTLYTARDRVEPQRNLEELEELKTNRMHGRAVIVIVKLDIGVENGGTKAREVDHSITRRSITASFN